MAQQVLSLFTRDLQRVLFPDNSILDVFPVEQGAIAINGTVGTVVRPQAGEFVGGSYVNPTYPLTADLVTDDVLNYSLGYHVSKPTLIADIESYTLNYDKRAHIIDQHAQTLRNAMIGKALFSFGVTGATKIVRTTGAARPASAPSVTGTRLSLTENDIVSAYELYTKENTDDEIAPNGYGSARALLIPQSMYIDIIKIKDFISYEKIGVPSQFTKFKPIGTLYGFPIYMRSTFAVYNNGTTTACVAKDYDPATRTTLAAAITDNEAAYMMNLNTVVVAKEPTTFRFDSQEATVLNGGIYYNAKGFFGSSFKRTDKKGVVAIVQVA